MPVSPEVASDVSDALSVLREQVDRRPELAMVLGSGLGDLADAADDAVVVPTTDLPGYPRSTVSGHHGRLVFGRLEGREVVIVQGRAHLYEGHTVQAATFPIRLVHAMGAQRLLVTNAAGGINPSFPPGTLMFITDHLNLTFENPLVGPGAGEGPRGGIDLSRPYDHAWLEEAERVALNDGIATRRGVYLWTRGPSYESAAEIRFFARIGADAVGMSTVPEVIEARRLGMKVLGLSTITNPAAGLSPVPLSHEEVLEVGARVREDLEQLVRGIMRAG